ncbi:hypothetical protein IWQ54_005183 [Labrenzia sp. EL_195]|nr:hypothetical protein [Labrenzia sp. EL_195]
MGMTRELSGLLGTDSRNLLMIGKKLETGILSTYSGHVA